MGKKKLKRKLEKLEMHLTGVDYKLQVEQCHRIMHVYKGAYAEIEGIGANNRQPRMLPPSAETCCRHKAYKDAEAFLRYHHEIR